MPVTAEQIHVGPVLGVIARNTGNTYTRAISSGVEQESTARFRLDGGITTLQAEAFWVREEMTRTFRKSSLHFLRESRPLAC